MHFNGLGSLSTFNRRFSAFTRKYTPNTRTCHSVFVNWFKFNEAKHGVQETTATNLTAFLPLDSGPCGHLAVARRLFDWETRWTNSTHSMHSGNHDIRLSQLHLFTSLPPLTPSDSLEYTGCWMLLEENHPKARYVVHRYVYIGMLYIGMLYIGML